MDLLYELCSCFVLFEFILLGTVGTIETENESLSFPSLNKSDVPTAQAGIQKVKRQFSDSSSFNFVSNDPPATFRSLVPDDYSDYDEGSAYSSSSSGSSGSSSSGSRRPKPSNQNRPNNRPSQQQGSSQLDYDEVFEDDLQTTNTFVRPFSPKLNGNDWKTGPLPTSSNSDNQNDIDVDSQQDNTWQNGIRDSQFVDNANDYASQNQPINPDRNDDFGGNSAGIFGTNQLDNSPTFVRNYFAPPESLPQGPGDRYTRQQRGLGDDSYGGGNSGWGSGGGGFSFPSIPNINLDIPPIPSVQMNIPPIPNVQLDIPPIPNVQLSIPPIPNVQLNIPPIPNVQLDIPQIPPIQINIPPIQLDFPPIPPIPSLGFGFGGGSGWGRRR